MEVARAVRLANHQGHQVTTSSRRRMPTNKYCSQIVIAKSQNLQQVFKQLTGIITATAVFRFHLGKAHESEAELDL